jgi:hypothetical protein
MERSGALNARHMKAARFSREADIVIAGLNQGGILLILS